MGNVWRPGDENPQEIPTAVLLIQSVEEETGDLQSDLLRDISLPVLLPAALGRVVAVQLQPGVSLHLLLYGDLAKEISLNLTQPSK